MTDAHTPSRDLLGLTVLAFLAEKPRHPYEIQRLIRERHKDFASGNMRGLYHTVNRLLKSGYIEAEETNRDGNRPERTTFRLTEAGREVFIHWLQDLLSTPLPEYPAFIAAISFLAHLPPAEALKALQNRIVMLEGELGAFEAYLRGLEPQLHRSLLLEMEYARTMRQAELGWVRSLSEDLRSGKLTWDDHWVNQ